MKVEQRVAGKLQALRRELKGLFVERDEFVDGALAALLARQHVLLIGPPGSGKSTIVHALCERIQGASYFHWLLTKFTTPEELFGPVSLQGRRAVLGHRPRCLFRSNRPLVRAAGSAAGVGGTLSRRERQR